MKKIEQPDPQKLKSMILEIKGLDLSNTSIEDIKTKIESLCKGHIKFTPIFNTGTHLYRGIKYESIPGNINKLSYPPVEQAGLNRASRKGDQLFYCSNSEAPPFYELDIQVGGKLVISTWITTEKLLVNNVGYTDSNYKRLGSVRSLERWDKLQDKKKINSEENDLIQNFLASSFSQKILSNNTDLFKLTIAIAEMQYSADIFDGLVYPTIQMMANADNFVLKKKAVDSNKIRLKEVYWIEITGIKGTKYDIQRLDWANSFADNGDIEWKGRLPQWTIEANGGQLKFVDENGFRKAYDKNGALVAPH